MRRLLTPLLTLLLVVAALVLSACGPDSIRPPGAAKVDVDTPQLRHLKAAAQIPDCLPGSAGAADGGLPAVTLPCLGGGTSVDLSTLRGPMIVNLWASWCGPCRRELPIYQRFFADHGDRVGVLGVDYQDVQPQAALELARASGVRYPLLADPQSALDGRAPFPHLQGLPFVALVDADGGVVYREFAEITSEQQLVDLADAHLGTHL
ncbi:MAG: TlpA family protein disulfide reductase [Nocardioides sp.]